MDIREQIKRQIPLACADYANQILAIPEIKEALELLKLKKQGKKESK